MISAEPKEAFELFARDRSNLLAFTRVSGNFMFYGWYIAIAGLIAYTLGYGARYSFSVIFPALIEEFKWPRDATAGMLSAHILAYGIASPFAGYLVDRTGPRKTMVGGAVLLSLGLVLSGFATRLWHFYITFGILSGIGLCFMGSVPFTTVVRNWFERKRGLAFSIIFCGGGLGFLFYSPLAWMIESWGWRAAFLAEGLVLGGVLVPLIVRVVRYHPSEKGLVQDGAAQAQERRTESLSAEAEVIDVQWAGTDWTLGKAIKTRRFWLMALTTFSLWGVMQHILVAHHVAYAIDAGFSRVWASSVLSLFGVLFAFGSLAGLISDRIGREWTITIGTAVGISAIIVFMLIQDASRPWMLYYYSLILGAGIGITAPTIAAAVTDIFQGPKVGFVIGSIWFGFALGGAIGPWLGGRLYEIYGNYSLAWITAILLYALACLAVWLAAPRNVRRMGKRRETPSTRK